MACCCCGAATRVESAKVNGRVLTAPDVDSTFDGPVEKRECRDVIFLILLVAFCVGGIIYLSVAAYNGDVRRLLYGVDNYGNLCGIKNEKLLNTTTSGQDFTTKPYFNPVTAACLTTCDTSSYTAVGYYCYPIPTPTTSGGNSAKSPFDLSALLNTFGSDVQRSWVWILVTCIIGLVLSILMIVLLRFLAGMMVWITVFVIVVVSIAGTIFLWVEWQLVRTSPDPNGMDTKYLVGAIFATIATVLLLILLIAMRKRIQLVIALFEEAGKAVAAMPLLMFVPLWTVMVMMLVCGVWAGGWVVIESSGIPTIANKTTGQIYFEKITVIEYLRIYHVFGLFWLTQFLIACQDITVAGAVSTWYFKRDKSQLGWPIIQGFRNLVLFHLGSAAFGALIIAIVKIIRYLLKQAQQHISPNSPLGCALKCCQCCLACFEKFLKYLTRNAYIEIAIFGCAFCKAAQKAFAIITANSFRVFAINFVGDFVLLLTKIAVVVITGFIGYQIIKANNSAEYIFVPVLIACIFVALIVHCFITIYEMTIDTLFICFCEDCAMNDGISKPYFMSRGLMKLVENSKKALEELDAKKSGKGATFDEVQQVGQYQVGASAFPSQFPTPVHHPTGLGMSPLHPAYKPNSIPPSPSRLYPNVPQ